MTTPQDVLNLAASQIGTTERTGRNDVLYADYWGITGYSWCYAFVQWCFDQLGTPLPYLTMYVPAGVIWSRNNGQSIERGGSPAPGDIVHFTWSMSEWPPDAPGTGDHVGLVESWDGGDTIYTIEGNVGPGDGVWRKARSISGTVVNFWRPSSVYGSAPASGPGPAPIPEEEDDVGFQIMSDPAQGGNGSVYGVFPPYIWAFSNNEIRGAFEILGAVKPGIAKVHPATVDGFIYRGVIEADTANESTGPWPHVAVLHDSQWIPLNQNIDAVDANTNMQVGSVHAHVDAARDQINQHTTAVGGSGGGGAPGAPFLDVPESLKKATVNQLTDELRRRVGSTL